MENRVCKNCKKDFTVLSDDADFYRKIDVPSPDFCPECRLTRRLLFRNERALYKRSCDLCHKDEILSFPSDSPFTVYCFSCWWSDNWDAKIYNREYDMSRPFFEQLKDLTQAVPRQGKTQQGNNINSVYTNRVSDLKNCYLCFGCNMNEDLQYCTWVNNSKECVDCFNVKKSERCYECIDCTGSYDLTYSRECIECSASSLLLNCRSCQDCFGCVNLRGKSFHIFNEPYSKEEYRVKVAEILSSPEKFKEAEKQLEILANESCIPWAIVHQVTNSTGNWLDETKNVWNGFMVRNIEDGRYIFTLTDAKDAMDHCHFGIGTELTYECVNVGRQCVNVRFSNECWNQLRDSEYCTNCHNSHDLFGCVGLRNAEYCIFNMQYSKEEYEALVPQIKEHMNAAPFQDARGIEYRYGSFFPTELSFFAYNETTAQDFFSKSKNGAEEFGARWKIPTARNYGITLAAGDVPKKIELINDTITKEIIGCLNNGQEETMCTTAFRITNEELNFHRKMKVSLPDKCPNCRHFARLSKRTPFRLNKRRCACLQNEHGHTDQCENIFKTSYPPESTLKIYCEKCYQAEVV